MPWFQWINQYEPSFNILTCFTYPLRWSDIGKYRKIAQQWRGPRKNLKQNPSQTPEFLSSPSFLVRPSFDTRRNSFFRALILFASSSDAQRSPQHVQSGTGRNNPPCRGSQSTVGAGSHLKEIRQVTFPSKISSGLDVATHIAVLVESWKEERRQSNYWSLLECVWRNPWKAFKYPADGPPPYYEFPKPNLDAKMSSRWMIIAIK